MRLERLRPTHLATGGWRAHPADRSRERGKERVLPPREILVVDDDPDIREGLAEVLKSEGYSVRTAADGADALRQIRARRVDLIVLDLMMPVMDGWQFRRAQRHERAIANIPVIVVTASGAQVADADAVLRKPFELSDLLREVNERCGRPGGDGEARP